MALRDEKDIVCLLCQEADEKRKVKDDTRNVLFYSYAVPGINGIYLNEGLTVAAQTIAQFGGGTTKGLEVVIS
jgi:DNA/RNA-binding domain of Phe-tRNA-synthetase-like protein